MDIHTAAAEVAETGRLLLKTGLVARTWGNFSARTDETHFCITPSGLGYEHMTAEDTVLWCLSDGTCTGTRKPSSEKRIHAAAYALFPDVGFVIHTHQTYATALGLTAPACLRITEEEKARLGGLAWAKYGLPGTKALAKNVTDAMQGGAHTVLMVHHGALICGKDRADALEKAELLEQICRRSCLPAELPEAQPEDEALRDRVRGKYPTARLEGSPASVAFAALKIPLIAELDDMAQMIGRSIPAAADAEEALALLGKHGSVFLPGTGAIVRGEDEEDSEALLLLTKKAATAALHCRAQHKNARLSLFDSLLMRRFYLNKYAKRKKG